MDSNKIGLSSLVLLIFFTVSGGPIGTEPAISAVGPYYGLLGMFVFPWVYSIPIALVSAELCTAFPHDGGYTVWVKEAFGFTLAFQEGYWSWISGVVDNAMYPVLITELLVGSDKATEYWYLSFAFALAMSLVNYMGVKIVGRSLRTMGIIVMLPYAFLVLLSLRRIFLYSADEENYMADLDNPRLHALAINGENGFPSKDGSLHQNDSVTSAREDWILFLNILFWNYSGWDSVSTFAGEVRNPSKIFPLSLAFGVLAVSFSYMIPLVMAILALPTLSAEQDSVCPEDTLDSSLWSEGSFLYIGGCIGGFPLYLMLIISGVCSAIGMFTTELFVDSYLLLGMSEQQLVPQFFQKRTQIFGSDSPYVAITVNLAIMLLLIKFLNFELLLEVTNCLSALSIILELIAAIYLRMTKPKIHRPYKVPLDPFGILAMLAVPFMILITLLFSGLFISPSEARLCTFFLFVAGFVAQYLVELYQGH